MNAVGCIRVSTVGQAKNGTSLEVQQARIEEYAAFKKMDLIGIEVDAGVSGKTIESREGIQRMLALVKQNKIDVVIVFKLSRLGRNHREALEISNVLQKKGVHLHSIAEGIDTSTSSGRLIFMLLSVIDEWERELIAENTCEALQYKRENGEKTGGSLPYGYEKYEKVKDNGRIVWGLRPDPKEQVVVDRVVTLREQGMTYAKITDALEAEGLLSRTGRRFKLDTLRAIVKRGRAHMTSAAA